MAPLTDTTRRSSASSPSQTVSITQLLLHELGAAWRHGIHGLGRIRFGGWVWLMRVINAPRRRTCLAVQDYEIGMHIIFAWLIRRLGAAARQSSCACMGLLGSDAFDLGGRAEVDATTPCAAAA